MLINKNDKKENNFRVIKKNNYRNNNININIREDQS